MPPFKARSRAEIAADIEKKSGKTPVWATIPIFDQNRDPWPVILTTLSAGYSACFSKIYPSATNEFGHNAMGEGTTLVQARRFDRPEQPLLACIEEYYRTNDVAGPGGNPIRVAFDEGSANAATVAAAKEREALIDAIKKDEDAKEASGAPGGSPPGTGPAAPGGSGPGGSGPGGSGPGGSGPGGSGPGGTNPGGVAPPTGFPLPPSTPPSGGPLPPTSGPEVTPELPGGTSGPVNITDLDTQDSPNPRDTLDFDDTGHELLVLGSVFGTDIAQNEIRVAGSQGASVQADIIQMETPPGGTEPTGMRFSMPDALVAGKDLNLTVTNLDNDVNGTPGPVTSPARRIQVKPVVTRVFTNPASGPFGTGGGLNQLIPGVPFKLTGQGFAAAPAEMEVKVNGQVATIQAVGPSGDGDPSVAPDDDDAIDVLCPASGGGTLGSQTEVTLTIRKGTPNETTIVVTPSPSISDPNNPTGNPQILSIENTGGTTLTEMAFASTGQATVVLVGRNFATTANANKIKWNGELLVDGTQVTYGPMSGTAGSYQRLQLTFNANSTVAPILRAGNTQIVLAVNDAQGVEKASAAAPIKVEPFIFAIYDCQADDCGGGTGAAGTAGTVQENQSFYLAGWGFGDNPSNVSLGIGGLTNVTRETAAFLTPGGVTSGYRVQFKMGNFTNLATGQSRLELGRLTIGGATFTLGGASFAPAPDIPLNGHINVVGTADP